MPKQKPVSNVIDYKQQKHNAKKNRSHSHTSSTNSDPYYMKKSKKKPQMETMEEDQATWAKGKIRSGTLFSDSECSSQGGVQNDTDSEKEQPVPIQIVNKQKQQSKKSILPPDSSSDSEQEQKKKKKKKNISRKGVFSDSGGSTSEDDNDSDSSDDSPKPQQPQPSILENITKYISEPGYVSKAKTIIKKVLNDRGSSNISIAFKGGKESSVLLHLIKTVMDEMQLGYDILDIIYFAPDQDEIKVLREYVVAFVKSLKMQKCLKIVSTNDITEGVQMYVHSSNINTMMIGIKSSDIGAKSLSQTMQTQDVVQLNRIHPLLSWTYKDVWDYINTNDIFICELYKSGHTKLQTQSTTTRNPLLSDKRSGTFKEAMNLTDVTKEDWSTFSVMEGKVLKGGQRGRILMGVPTARIDTVPYEFDDGIYIGKARVNEVDKKYRKAIISISSRIDISGKPKRTVAVYIAHKYTTDFYGKYVNIHVLGLLRKQQQYENEVQLRTAMDVDIKYLESIVIDRDMKI